MFAEVGRQLDARGLIVREGTLDATLAAAVKPPKSDAGEASERDPQAGWTKKNGRSHFGYKAHVAVDKGSKIKPAGGGVDPGRREGAVYGDKAYASQALRGTLVLGKREGFIVPAGQEHSSKYR